jgi:regulator of protease activity HflC (stomatin/prohibitin superfamily)
VGIVSRSGVLEALPSGIHLIVPPDKLLSSISVQQEILPLGNRPYRSYDNFPLNINADVFYTITDPGKAVSFVRDIIKYITDTSIATLNGILQHSTIGDIGKSAVPAYRAANENASISLSSEAISAPDINDSLYSRVHDGFIVELNKDLQLHGIEINNIRIESLTISDPKLSENISAQALITAQTATTLANIDSQTRIKVAEARREADVACIEAGMKANNEKIAADAAAAVLATQAKAQAAAIITEATAQAEATKLQAEADKIRRRCEADADSGYANAIGSTRVGVTLELAKLQAKTMTGVSKTIYLPNESVSALANFNMFTRVLNDNHQDSVSSTVQSSEHSSLGNSLVSS